MPRAISSFSTKEIKDLFGVSKDATSSDINKAYYKLSKKYHPDSRSEDSQIDWDGIFPLLGEMKEILLDPEKRKTHRRAYRLGMPDRYRMQFDNYQKLFIRSLELTLHVRTYVLDPLRAAIAVLHESDTAAKVLLEKLKSGSASFEDVKSFAEGVGGWTGSSAKTLFFSLLCDLTDTETSDVKTDEECKRVVCDFTRVLCSSEKDLLSNPNPGAVEKPDYFVNQYDKVSTQIMACEAELMFLEDNLKPEELDADTLKPKIEEEKAKLENKKSILQSHILVCNAFREAASDAESKITPAILELQLKNQEFLYRIECLQGPDHSDSSDDEIESLLEMVSDLNNRIRMLQGSGAKPALLGGVSAAASGGGSGGAAAAGGAGAVAANVLTLFAPATTTVLSTAAKEAAAATEKPFWGRMFGVS